MILDITKNNFFYQMWPPNLETLYHMEVVHVSRHIVTSFLKQVFDGQHAVYRQEQDSYLGMGKW